MYLQLFQDIMGFISITDNILIDIIILLIAAKIVHLIVFANVGKLYDSGMINGSFAGKIAYLIGWGVCLIPSALILFILGRIIVLFKWIF